MIHNAATFREAFSDRDWAVGEDYLLQERVHDLRRYRSALAGRVQGVRGDYWVRVSLTGPPVSVCDCGRPRCRHAAALLQAYLSERVPVIDAGRAITAFLAAPRSAPLAAAALGEDLLAAFSMPPDDAADIWALPEAGRVLALDRALQSSSDPAGLLLDALRSAEASGPVSDWLHSALSAARLATSDWLTLFATARGRFAGALLENLPEQWSEDDTDRALGRIYALAAAGDLQGAAQVARVVARLGSRRRVLRALADLAFGRPRIAADLLELAREGREVRWACRIAERSLPQLEGSERLSLEAALLEASKEDPPTRARLLLTRAARNGGRRDLLGARREAIAAGVWARLRGGIGHLLSHRPDGVLREVELWLADGDLVSAARAAERAESSHMPHRLLADALAKDHPAQALQHYLRAQRIAAAQGTEDALLESRIAALRARVGVQEQVGPVDRRT